MHALLAAEPPADIILFQEPWYDQIGVRRSDTDPAGTNTLGGVSSPLWNYIYPGIKDLGTTRAKVMAYSHKSNTRFTVANRLLRLTAYYAQQRVLCVTRTRILKAVDEDKEIGNNRQ
jgi:hypothetical protein